jgi:hypothetical protein
VDFFQPHSDMTEEAEEQDPRPSKAFFAFSAEKRPAYVAQGMKMMEIGKQLGDDWRALGPEGQRPDKEAYEKAKPESRSENAKRVRVLLGDSNKPQIGCHH